MPKQAKPAMIHVSASCNDNFFSTGSHYLGADTTAFMQALQSGFMRDFPSLRWVIPHGGGAVHQITEAFDEDTVVSTGDDIIASAYGEIVSDNPAFSDAVEALVPEGSAEERASAIEFLLEGMHLTKRLNKDAVAGRSSFRIRY